MLRPRRVSTSSCKKSVSQVKGSSTHLSYVESHKKRSKALKYPHNSLNRLRNQVGWGMILYWPCKPIPLFSGGDISPLNLGAERPKPPSFTVFSEGRSPPKFRGWNLQHLNLGGTIRTSWITPHHCIFQELISVIVSPPITPNIFWGFNKRTSQGKLHHPVLSLLRKMTEIFYTKIFSGNYNWRNKFHLGLGKTWSPTG